MITVSRYSLQFELYMRLNAVIHRFQSYHQFATLLLKEGF